jgi:multiple sugar transport system substrate-binding protein
VIKKHLPAVLRSLRAPGRIATALCAVALLAGCAASSGSSASGDTGTAQHPVTITVWDWVNSSQAISLFEKTHPGIKVKLDLVPAGAPTYAKMFAAIKAGNAPDVGLIEYNTLPQFVASGGLLNLDNYGADALKNQFVGWAWNQVSLDGGVYALPLSASPIGYHFNMTLLKKYGIDTVPTTYAQLAADAKIYHQRNPKGYLIGVPPDSNYLAMLTWQDGGQWFTAKGNTWQVGFTSPQSHMVANYLQSLVDNGDAFTDMTWLTPWYQGLSSGELASFVGPQWADALLAQQAGSQSGQFRVSEAPQWVAGHQVDGQSGGGTLAVFKDTKYPAAAYTFVQWMLTNPQAQVLNYEAGYGWPTTTSGAKISQLNAKIPYLGGENPGPIYAKSNETTDQNWQWGPNYNSVTSDLNNYLAQALSGHGTIWQALQHEEATELQELKSQGISAEAAS